jgi:hypothetical protein
MLFLSVVMAGLVTAVHGLAPAMTCVIEKYSARSISHPDRTVFSWMAGSKPGHDGETVGRRPNT